ncbi:MAG: MXAN_2562 family outer membrane beta-barrel protein [Planctomycetota bacterium]
MRFGIEGGLGSYRPQVDGESGVQTPYADIFQDSAPLMGQLRLHLVAPTALGQLGFTLGAGYFTDTASALTTSGERSAGQTRLRLVPVSLLARWRRADFDDWLGLPIAVHAAAGVSYTLWTITQGEGRIASVGDIRGNGGTLSAQVEGGLGLRLNLLDRRAGKILERDFGISDTEIGIGVMYVSPPIGWWSSLEVGALTWRSYVMVQF